MVWQAVPTYGTGGESPGGALGEGPGECAVRSPLTRCLCAAAPADFQPVTEGEEEDDPAAEQRRQRGKSLVEARKETWLLEAAQETARLGENLLNDGLHEVDAAMVASMAALNSALALEESLLHQDAPVALPAVDAAALLGPGPGGLPGGGETVSALGGMGSVDTSALINATALLGPGAGGLLPPTAQPSLLPGGDAWDEMEKRMAALQATLEDGGEGASGSAAQDEARLAARAARMREREAKRQAKRAGTQHVPATGGMSAATATLASHATGAQMQYGVVQPAVPVAPSPGGRVVIQPGVVRAKLARAVCFHRSLCSHPVPVPPPPLNSPRRRPSCPPTPPSRASP